MLSKLASFTLVGIDATPVEVEVDVSFSSQPKTVLARGVGGDRLVHDSS
jgi:magnesium chelatase family protein